MTERADSQDVNLTRRQFVQATATVGAMGGFSMNNLWLAGVAGADSAPSSQPAEALPVAMIGVGSQGRNLMFQALKIPGIRFISICDIWPYHQKYAANILKKFDQTPTVYSDYREMLEKEKNLAAVIVATPDWMHSEQTVACLRAGRHVYCEKEMSNTVDGCRAMVKAAKETGKVLQIGHQRRSNPRYALAMKMIYKDRLLGRITHLYGQWNRARWLEQGTPKGEELDAETLKRHGYDTMDQFRNWRWYRKFSGGAIADLGSHQIDVFNWILRSRPKSVLASGGTDYYKGREWYDNVMAIYEYASETGPVRAFYQVLNTTSYGDYYEAIMGDEGTLVVSEDPRKGFLFKELLAARREWENDAKRVENMGREAIELKIGETLDPQGRKTAEGQKMLEESKKPPHQLHLENFFTAARAGKPDQVSCPPEVGFETAVTVLRANEAVEAGKRLEFKADDFKV